MTTTHRYIVYNKEQDEVQGYANTIVELVNFTKKTQRTVYNWLKEGRIVDMKGKLDAKKDSPHNTIHSGEVIGSLVEKVNVLMQRLSILEDKFK